MGGLDLVAIHEGFAAQLRTHISRDVTIYPFDPGSARSYPCIVIDPGDPWAEYHETFGDNAIAGIELRIKVYIAADDLSQRLALADFASAHVGATSSILRAIEADTDVGGVVSCAVVHRVGALEQADEDGVMMATFDVSAMAHRED
jgi:hypothetical protein